MRKFLFKKKTMALKKPVTLKKNTTTGKPKAIARSRTLVKPKMLANSKTLTKPKTLSVSAVKSAILKSKKIQKAEAKKEQKKNKRIKPKSPKLKPQEIRKHLVGGLKKTHKSPIDYKSNQLRQMANEFYQFNNRHNYQFNNRHNAHLRVRQLPIDPSRIKLDPRDPLSSQKKKYIVNRGIAKFTNARGYLKPKIIGNVYEVKLAMILKNNKLSAYEKQQHMNRLLQEVNTYEKQTNITNKMHEIYNERKRLEEKLLNVFKDINTLSGDGKYSDIISEDRSEFVSFYQSWRNNLHQVNAIHNQYADIKSEINDIKKKIAKSKENIK